MAEQDAQDLLKKRARRRLIGAVALALLAAIVLPWVMDSEPRRANSDLQIRVPGAPEVTLGAKSSAPIESIVEPVAPVSVVRSSASASSTGAAALVSTAASTSSRTASSQTHSKASAKSSAKASSSHATSSKGTSKLDAAARARALLEGRVADDATGEEARSFVQLGAYKDADNAKNVAAQVKKVGMLPSVETIADKTRVRVGPFKTRQAAEAALAKLKAAGLSGVVTSKAGK